MEKGPKLLEELLEYYQSKENDDNLLLEDGLREIEPVRYDNPYEAYLTAQIQIIDALIPVLDRHIFFLEEGEDIDLVIASFEHSIYQVKKQAYSNVEDWEALINHLADDRLEEIQKNPKGHGDLLINELMWIRNYEKKWKK